MAPHGARPRRIAQTTCDNMDMKLRDQIAQCANIDFGRTREILEHQARLRNFLDQPPAIQRRQVMQLAGSDAPRHQYEPGKAGVLHQQYPRQWPVGYVCRVGRKPGMKGKFHRPEVLPLREHVRKLGLNIGTNSSQGDARIANWNHWLRCFRNGVGHRARP